MESREVADNRQPVRRVLIDISHTISSGLNTGIQRVVRKLAEQLPEAAAAAGIECYSVVYRDGCFQYADRQDGWLLLDHRQLRVQPAEALPNWYRVTANWLCGSRATSGLRHWLLPESGRLGLFYVPAKLASACGKPLPDGYWAFSQIWPGVAAAKEQGARIALIVYDLICLQHPEFFAAGAQEKFAAYVDNAFQHADQIVAISSTVEQEVRKMLSAHATRSTQSPGVCNFRLGADIVRQVGLPRPKVQQLFSTPERATYLIVSTLEPRKNHRVVLDAFDELWKHGDAQLLIIGRRGWMCEELIQRITEHAEYGNRLYWLNDMNDSELSYCYGNSSAVICPSLAEGFGLPIVEALWHQKTTIASDIAIHREVGGTHCHYFPKDDPQQLANLIRSLPCRSPRESPPAVTHIQNWQSSAEQLLEILRSVAATGP